MGVLPRYVRNARGHVRHIRSDEEEVTLCGLDIEWMQNAQPLDFAMPICEKCLRIDLPVKIVTVEVMKKTHGRYKSPVGWKVYINGAKYPAKPMEYYELSEHGAILIAIGEYKSKHGV